MRKRGHMRKTEAMINEIEKVIIGKREVIEQVLMTILAKGHVLLEDIPGRFLIPQPPVPNNEAIRKLLDEKQVDWAHLEPRGESLRIR